MKLRRLKAPILLLLLLALAACSNAKPYATTVGILHPGATIRIRVTDATLSAYQPATGDPRDRFTLEATAAGKGAPPAAPRLAPLPHGGVVVTALNPLASLLVRVPDGVTLVVDSQKGDVNVTDITGNAKIGAKHGNVTVMLPGYAEASVGEGNVNVTMGAIEWPGTLHITTQQGDIEVWISEKAAFDVHLHTGNGTLFSDFDLRGTSQGASETIDGSVNGGGSQRIDIETAAGAIRLLRLHPQA